MDDWRPLYRAAAAAALVILALMPVQMAAFVVSPPPEDVPGMFALFQRSALLGLVALDLVYMADILLMAVVLLALCVALRRTRPALLLLAVFTCTISTAIYFASNTSFEMLALSRRHAAATTPEERAALLAAGEAMLAVYKGTAFNVSYVLAAASGLLVAAAMLRSDVFGRGTAWLGVVIGILGIVPPTIGTAGMVIALAYLPPFAVWLVLIARRLLVLARAPSA